MKCREDYLRRASVSNLYVCISQWMNADLVLFQMKFSWCDSQVVLPPAFVGFGASAYLMFNFPNNLISSTKTDNQIKSDRSKYTTYIHIIFLPPIFVSSLKLRRFDLAHARRPFVRSPKGQFHHLHTLADTSHLSIGKQFNLLKLVKSARIFASQQIRNKSLRPFCYGTSSAFKRILFITVKVVCFDMQRMHTRTHLRFWAQVDATNGIPLGQ